MKIKAINIEVILDAITRSLHGKANCITVNFDRTQLAHFN